jgi:hypothetical protein
LKIMIDCGVSTVSLSYMGLRRRVKFTRPWTIAEHYPKDLDIFLDSGSYTLNRPGASYSDDDARALASAYIEFVTENLDSVTMVSEFDATQLGQDWIQGMREDFWDDLPAEKFLPVWHEETGPEELERLCARYKRVGVLPTSTGSWADSGPTLNRLVSRYGVRLHGVSMTQMDAMREIRWDSVGSTSWLSPVKNGDFIVWTGHDLSRYPRSHRDSGRKRHRTWCEQNGFDPALLADDSTPAGKKEVLRLSLWSWQHFVADINRRRGSNYTPPAPGEALPEEPPAEVDIDTLDPRNLDLVPARPTERRRQLLPIIGYTPPAGTGEDSGPGSMTPNSRSLMACDTCFAKDKCPGFQAGASCLYEIPVVVRTVPERMSVWDTMIEMQTQRVLRMLMFEQFEGGYADSNASSEIDRLHRMLKTRADAEKQGFSLTISGTSNAEPGMLSRVFGDRAGAQMSALPAPQYSAEVMSEIIDVDAT